MGYLTDTSQTLSFNDVQGISKYIKQNGILQFLHLYKKFKDFQQDKFHWGDEIEMHLLHIDPQTKIPKLQLNTEYMFETLNSKEFALQPEYGAWMLETVPYQPYEFDGDPNVPLQNFITRRKTITSLCKEGDVLYAGTVFPTLKVGDYYVPKARKRMDSIETTDSFGDEKESLPLEKERHLASDLLNPHPRYSTLCENVKLRRKEDISILVPIYIDEKTSLEKTIEEPYPGFIYMDETLFGTSNTSIQVTFGTKDIDTARYLADQMAIISTILLPLSAASPIFKGKIADTDTRWNVLSESIDCRTPEERDVNSPEYIPLRRWAPTSLYISTRPECKDEYNDIMTCMDQEMMEFTRQKARELDLSIDERLVRHLGFLFKSDPLIVYSDRIYVDNLSNTNHFENLQSTNWNSVRFKPPPGFDSDVGWRVELRTVEAQLTPQESTAFAMFAYFFMEMVTKKGYNFYIPMSKLHENMARAHKRDAVLTERYWFRKDVEKESEDEWVELTISEILHGKMGVFVGLFNLIYRFCREEYGIDMENEWKAKKMDKEGKVKISKIAENMEYFEILSKRAKGEMPTIAHWIRDFVLKHPLYQKDSIVTPEIAGDLISAMVEISDNKKIYQDFM